jgi:hypothetical protein
MRIFDPLIPDRGERGPAIESKRRTVNGILCVLRIGGDLMQIKKLRISLV